jgi:hypothetical protein
MDQQRPGQPASARVINWLIGICTRVLNIRGSNGIEVKNLPSGIYISFTGQSQPQTFLPKFIMVRLVQDGGSDGITSTGQEATWTYKTFDINTGANISVQTPVYGHRAEAQNGTIPGTWGMLVKVTDPANIGYGGAQDIAINTGNGYGFTGSGSGSGAPVGSTDQPWRLQVFDEQFLLAYCAAGSGSGSGDGGASPSFMGGM